MIDWDYINHKFNQDITWDELVQAAIDGETTIAVYQRMEYARRSCQLLANDPKIQPHIKARRYDRIQFKSDGLMIFLSRGTPGWEQKLMGHTYGTKLRLY